jgi:hypothetical protein
VVKTALGIVTPTLTVMSVSLGCWRVLAEQLGARGVIAKGEAAYRA